MPPDGSIHLGSRLSYLALYPAMYTLGVYLLAVLALELPSPDWHTVTYILLIAHSCYLLDRVKLSDNRQDPADAIALPDRALLFAERSRSIRAVLVLELLLAMVTGFLISPLLTLIPLGALFGVHLYAGRGASPGRPRFKDIRGLKSFFISSAHLALVIAALWGNDHDLIEHPRLILIFGLLGIWLIVSADAILCDLDDMESDAIYATHSIPVLLGPSRAWGVALVIMTLGAACLFLRHAFTLPLTFASIAILLSALPTLKSRNRRDLIDARLLPIAVIALLLR